MVPGIVNDPTCAHLDDARIVGHGRLVARLEIGRLEHLVVHQPAVVDRDLALGRERQLDQLRLVVRAHVERQALLVLRRVDFHFADLALDGHDPLDRQFRGLASRLLAEVVHHDAVAGLQVGNLHGLAGQLGLPVED